MRIALRRGNCNFDGALQDKCGIMEMAMGIRDYDYGHTMGTGMGMLRVWSLWTQAYMLA